MPRYKLTIEYDGTDFSGWQIQPTARTVEEELEQAFSHILQQPIDLIGQGRTDAGVHARAQVAHFDVPEALKNPQKLIFGVNGLIGTEVQVHSIEQVSDDFHCRFAAVYREYSYTMYKHRSPLNHRFAWELPNACNVDVFKQCAQLLNGEFDFAGFSKYNVENYTTLCTILKSELEEYDDRLVFRVRANRFLRNMVRRLVGTMYRVAEGKLTKEDFELLLKNANTKISTYTAPAKGLVLEEIYFEKNQN